MSRAGHGPVSAFPTARPRRCLHSPPPRRPRRPQSQRSRLVADLRFRQRAHPLRPRGHATPAVPHPVAPPHQRPARVPAGLRGRPPLPQRRARPGEMPGRDHRQGDLAFRHQRQDGVQPDGGRGRGLRDLTARIPLRARRGDGPRPLELPAGRPVRVLAAGVARPRLRRRLGWRRVRGRRHHTQARMAFPDGRQGHRQPGAAGRPPGRRQLQRFGLLPELRRPANLALPRQPLRARLGRVLRYAGAGLRHRRTSAASAAPSTPSTSRPATSAGRRTPAAGSTAPRRSGRTSSTRAPTTAGSTPSTRPPAGCAGPSTPAGPSPARRRWRTASSTSAAWAAAPGASTPARGKVVWSFDDGRYTPVTAGRTMLFLCGHRTLYALVPR